MKEHPIKRQIVCIQIHPLGAGDCSPYYTVGQEDVTGIEACEKSGLYANLPYIRVWQGDDCIAEFCQHNIVGVYFAPPTH